MRRLRPTRVASLVAVVACLALACGSAIPRATSESPAPWWPEASPGAAAWTPTLDPATIDEPLPQVFGGSMATAVVAFGNSLLAFGGINGGCCDASFSTDTRGVVWTSGDGSNWRLQGADPDFALAGIAAAAASVGHAIVVGERRLPPQTDLGGVNRQGAVWMSSDGVAWELATDVPIFTTVAATPAAFIAASNLHAFPELWWSETGATWERIAGLQELGIGRIDRLLATPIGIFGVGSSVNPEAQDQIVADPPAAVWRSTDGRSWVRVPDGAMFSGATMQDVAWSDGRLLAIGWGATPARPAFWTSTDGDAWDRIEPPSMVHGSSSTNGPVTTDVHATHVIAISRGFAVTGTWLTETGDTSTSGMVTWATQDGRAWQGSARKELSEINDWAAMPGGGLAAVGWGPAGGRMVPVAWTIATPS